MSTAILISGQLRSFAQCYPTQRWQVYRHYDDCHFFILVENNDQVNSIQALRRDYGEDHVHAQFISDPTGLPQIAEEYGKHSPFFNTAPHSRLMLQFWYQNEVWKFFQQERGDKEFETIIRMRGDSWIQKFDTSWSGDACNVPADWFDWNCSLPWWGRFGGANDRMAILGKRAAPIYFNLYNSIQSLLEAGCPFHPETLLLAHLEKNNVRVKHTLNAIFGTLRLPRFQPDTPNSILENPPGKWVQEMRFPEIQPHEIAEYAKL